MRVALLYPPPWKIPGPNQPPYAAGEGPPADFTPGDLDADFYQIPYGLLTLGSEARRAGHDVKVYNLAGFLWSHVQKIIGALEADVFGLSCWTANRRGVALVAREIKHLHPKSSVLVGGPHATALGPEMLTHFPEIDLVFVGESESSFLEFLARLEKKESISGIAGTVYRDSNNKSILGPKRKTISDLDTLASPQDYFNTHILMTARGCPWSCTFCGAESSWGRGFRGFSVPYVLDALEKALPRLPVKMIQIKDDTFTANKKRVFELCREIRNRKLRFLWSCDTRVDVLTEDLLYEMRLAGCERLSLGVESGSASVLKNINKKITVGDIIRSTELARKYGIQVRYFMMLGNRGETLDTFAETLEFLQRAKPHQFLFSCLSIYPGTPDFTDAEKAGWLDREVYFTDDFQELKMPFDADEETTRVTADWFAKNKGLQLLYRESVEGYRAILDRLGDYAPAYMDLGAAQYGAGLLDEAEANIRRALHLEHPLPGLAHNYLACISLAGGDLGNVFEHLQRGIEADPQHVVLLQNYSAADRWRQLEGPAKRLPLQLAATHDFQLLERSIQPTLPGPLPPDFADWMELTPPKPMHPIRPEEVHAAQRRRLPVNP